MASQAQTAGDPRSGLGEHPPQLGNQNDQMNNDPTNGNDHQDSPGSWDLTAALEGLLAKPELPAGLNRGHFAWLYGRQVAFFAVLQLLFQRI